MIPRQGVGAAAAVRCWNQVVYTVGRGANTHSFVRVRSTSQRSKLRSAVHVVVGGSCGPRGIMRSSGDRAVLAVGWIMRSSCSVVRGSCGPRGGAAGIVRSSCSGDRAVPAVEWIVRSYAASCDGSCRDPWELATRRTASSMRCRVLGCSLVHAASSVCAASSVVGVGLLPGASCGAARRS